VTVYDRDTPVARLVPYESRGQDRLPVRKATSGVVRDSAAGTVIEAASVEQFAGGEK
jgi:antitoxin (DNA-binding transcriptional repressor) of toxin-antitoxin stability system